jgi:hypothetical protein
MLTLRRNRISRSPWHSASREELQAAVQCLRDNFIMYTGPFVIRSGVIVFEVSDYILTADELVGIHKRGLLSKEGLAKFAKDLEAVEERFSVNRKP